jgi:hypothetical protein
MLVTGPWLDPPSLAALSGPDRAFWPPGVLTTADEARIAGYGRALAFYNGQQWPAPQRREESRLTLNYARVLVRKTASYVFPGPVSHAVLPDDDGATTGADAGRANTAERLLAATASALDLARLDLALAIDAAVLGDAALKVTWDARRGQPRVVAVDPGSLVVACAPDDPRDVETVTHTYGLTGDQVRRLFGEVAEAAADTLGLAPHQTYPVVETWTAAAWRLTIAGQQMHDVANPYGWIPYLVVANNPRPFSFWGQSELTDLLDVCRELNRRMTVLSRILELSGAPIAVLENVDGSDGIAVGPGAKWELPEGAKAYLLDLLQGGSTEVHLAYVTQLFRVLHDLAETPRTAFGDSGRDLSGAALEVEIQPLVQKVGRMRRMWDGVFARRNAMLLDLLERFGGHDLQGLRRTATIWPAVLPSDTDASVRNAVALVGSGIQSRRSAIAALGGDDPDAELARMREEGQHGFGPGGTRPADHEDRPDGT